MTEQKRNIAIAYHFFAHYRKGILHELARHGKHHYTFVGGTKDPYQAGIKPWTPDDKQFIKAPCYHLGGPFLWQTGLIKLAVSRKYDTIIYLGMMYWPAVWLSSIIARLFGKKVYFWTHGWTREDQGIQKWVRNLFYRIPHGLLLYGHYAKCIGMLSGIDPDRLHVIYNSLDYREQVPIRSTITTESILQTRMEVVGAADYPLVVCTSRLVKARRLDQLIQALGILKEQGSTVDLLLVGDGPEQDSLQELADKHKVRVIFYGPCYDENILARLISSANVCVAPGKVGLTAMHSLVYGTPVLTHDDPNDQMPEWEAIIPGKTGDLFKRGDIHDLARKIEYWIRNPLPTSQNRLACHAIIDKLWNPIVQKAIIERAMDGQPADDLYPNTWQRNSEKPEL